MEICEECEIVYTCGFCPLCEARDAIQVLENNVDDLEKKVADLEKEIEINEIMRK